MMHFLFLAHFHHKALYESERWGMGERGGSKFWTKIQFFVFPSEVSMFDGGEGVKLVKYMEPKSKA